MMLQKRLAAEIMGCSPHRVRFDPEHLPEIKEAITKFDVRRLIAQKIITEKPVQGQGKYWSRKLKEQKRKGRRSGHGTRKGKPSSRLKPKKAWMMRIRKQRDLIKRLKSNDKIDSVSFRELYRKTKGGFFRSLQHLKGYIQEQNIIKK